jgi:GAF domain-containing protein
MGDKGSEDLAVELERARATIREQAARIDALRALAMPPPELGRILTLARVAGTLAATIGQRQLLRLIVETAAAVIDADAAALFLIDEEDQSLVFEVALGEHQEEARQFRVPLGQGIAGLVAVSGQPMAIANASQDPRHAAEIAAQIGHFPKSILCVPLYCDGDVTGVLELLDKRGAPSFSPADMQAMGLFANLAATVIKSALLNNGLAGLIDEALVSAGGDGERSDIREAGQRLAAAIEADPPTRRTLALAELVMEIGNRGGRELELCEGVLREFSRYTGGLARDEASP